MPEKTFNNEVGMRIRFTREYSKYSREELAEKADISTQFLADIETGRKSMTIKTLKNLCSALHVSTDYIIYGSLSTSTNNNDDEHLSQMIKSLGTAEKIYAEEMIKIFIKALDDSKK